MIELKANGSQEEDDGKCGCIEYERREGGHAGALRRALRAGPGERGPAVGGGQALPRLAAPGHAQDQEPHRGRRFGQEAMEAEGHGTGAYRLGALASVASWLHGAWTPAAQLRLCLSAQEAAGRAALGPGRKAGRRQADGGRHAGDSRKPRPSSTARRSTSST